MSEPIITVENLSKSYLLGHRAEPQGRSSYTALRDIIGREVRNLARKTIDVVRGRQVLQGDEVEEFWALKDVSFEVQQGEVLGIIGRNGAGKSTLLKVLSRITEPTSGRVILRGRVASLLEVGTGFHPELSGRENIYLNGAILGMRRDEIRKKFDEIVAFAEVEKFLDTPVKRYSSGMYVRLAFAVAAHLEPEILIVDEVLAVGDAEFQKKCLGKMQDVSRREGRTVLFISHNMSAITALCERGIILCSGRLDFSSRAHEVVERYYSQMLNVENLKSSIRGQSSLSANITDGIGKPVSVITAVGESYVEFQVIAKSRSRWLQVAFTIFNSDNVGLISSVSPEYPTADGPAKVWVLRAKLPASFLNGGQYRIEGAALDQDGVFDQVDNLALFYVRRESPFDIKFPNSNGLIRFDDGWLERPLRGIELLSKSELRRHPGQI